MSKTEFSTAVGQKSSAFATTFFNGKRRLASLVTLFRIARLLGTSVGYLVGETDPDEDTLGAILRESTGLSKENREIVLNLATQLPKEERSMLSKSAEADRAAPPSKLRKRSR